MSKALMSVDDVARAFGVCRATVWNWCKVRDGFPKPQKFGGSTRWCALEVEFYIKSAFGNEVQE